MGWLDAPCKRCGRKYPQDQSTQDNASRPKYGHVGHYKTGLIGSELCCERCYDLSVNEGWDFSDKEKVREWGAKDWSAAKIQTEMELNQAKARAQSVKVTTGDVRWDYEIERVVFNIGADEESFLQTASPQEAMRAAELALKVQAAELKCDAVIHTMFEHRIATGADKLLGGKNRVIEVFAYGTAVRRVLPGFQE